jgi:hypothetical protein
LNNGKIGRGQAGEDKKITSKWNQRSQLLTTLLGGDPQLIVNSLLDILSQGATEEELASTVAYAAAMRIAQFHTRNELGDWDAVLHTFYLC